MLYTVVILGIWCFFQNIFNGLDEDGDNKITKDEFRNQLCQKLDRRYVMLSSKNSINMLNAKYFCIDTIYNKLYKVSDWWVTWRMSYKKQEVLTIRDHLVFTSCFYGVRGVNLLSSFVVGFFGLFVFVLYLVTIVAHCLCIVHS